MTGEIGEEGAAKFRAFVLQRYLPWRKRPLSNDEPLISSGIVDSMGLVDLTTFIEEEFGVFIGPDEFGDGRADTLAQVLALIARRR
jgi:acyl carrier protein